MSVSVILNTGAIAAGLVPLAFIQKPQNPMTQTLVAIGVGSGGSVPHVAIWDDDGNRITQFKGDANGHICKGETWQTTLDNEQNGMRPANPTYVSIVMQENDAICVAAVVVSGNGNQWTWTGDMAYTCGAQWFESQYIFQGSNVPIRCAWIDADHTNNIVAKGINMHIRDFTADQGLVDQYNKDARRLCQNTARMSFSPEPIVPDSMIKFFSPPLEYTRDENADKPDLPSTAGALKEPDRGIDKKTSAYPDGTDMNIGKKNGKRHARDFRNLKVRGVKNFQHDTLVVSHFERHSAKELCENPMSLGSDFVSVREGIFCDMETAKWWPLCDSNHTKECFDLETQSLKVSDLLGLG